MEKGNAVAYLDLKSDYWQLGHYLGLCVPASII